MRMQYIFIQQQIILYFFYICIHHLMSDGKIFSFLAFAIYSVARNLGNFKVNPDKSVNVYALAWTGLIC